MHYAISTTWGPTDTTRAAIPFAFAATALEAGDSVTIMLFHDAATLAIPGVYENIVPFGPPKKFAEVFSHHNAEVIVCKPCAELRGIHADQLRQPSHMGGMGDFYKVAAQEHSKVINF